MNLTEAELKDVLDILSSKLSHHMNRIELLRQERERKGRKIPTRDELELVNKVRNLQQHFHKLTNNKFNEGIEMNEDINDPKYQQKKEKKLASLSKQIDDHVDRLGLATEKRKMKTGGAQYYQSDAEVRLHSKISNMRQDHHRLKVGDIWPKKKSIWEDLESPDYIEDLSEEELMELDKKTLASYIKKAHRSGEMSGIRYINSKENSPEEKKYLHKANQREKGINRATDRLVKEDLEDLIDNIQSENYVEASNIFQQILSQKINDNIEEMKYGVNESVDLEDLSEEELMELDKKTLASYIKKANVDQFSNGAEYGVAYSSSNRGEMDKYHERKHKRKRGISRATDRLVNK